MAIKITSRQNDKIRAVNRLKNKKFRDQEQSFIVEGKKLFLEAFSWNVEITEIFTTTSFLASADDTLLRALKSFEDRQVPIFHLDAQVFESLSSMKVPEGIVCTAKKIKKEKKNIETYVILDDIQDPGNVGTIIRTADAAGFDAVICSSKTADIYNEKVLRGSMGSIFHLPIEQVSDLKDTVLTLKSEKVCMIGSSLLGKVKPFSLEDGQSRAIALILGNESKGMSVEIADLCDQLYKLPMFGSAESLNVSVAAGIFMYDIARALIK